MISKLLRDIAFCALVASLSACGDSGSSSSGTSATPSTPTANGTGAVAGSGDTPTTSLPPASTSTPPATGTTPPKTSTPPPTTSTTPPPSSTPPKTTSKALVKLSAAQYSVAATSGKAVLAVERTGSSGSTSIRYTTSDGSGVDGVDYKASTGTLSWGDGDTALKKIYVEVGAKASGKTFKVGLTPVNNSATVAAPSIATVTITATSEALPPAAEEAGFRTVTFGPALKMEDNWYDMNFFGWGGEGGSNNSDGSVAVSGKGTGTIATAVQDWSKQHDWKGTAFGGGAYFEAVFTFANANDDKLWPRWPSFWALDIENMSANAVTSLTQWQGQPAGYGNWIETDFFEYDRADTGSYGVQIHNWYGYHVPPGKGVHAYKDSVQVPAGYKWTDKHKYGFLWVPATATTQGRAQAYLDDAPVLHPVFWNKYDPKSPPTPVPGTSAWSVLDSRHMTVILDTGPKNPMTIYSMTVWQKSKAGNITQ